MDEVHVSLQQRLDACEARVRSLQSRVDGMAKRLLDLEEGSNGRGVTADPQVDHAAAGDGSGSIWNWFVGSRFMPRLAAISFALVLALVLRTLTDGGVLDTGPGIAIGLGYAAALMALGWRRLARSRFGGQVFSVCGAVLLCAMVLEAHGRFRALSGLQANLLLAAAMAAMAAIGLGRGRAIVVEIGVLVPALASVALGYPNPSFPLVAVLLLAANAVAAAARRLRTTSWLPWVALLLTLFFWLLWSFKAAVGLAREGGVPSAAMVAWHLPMLAVTFVVLTAIPYLRLVGNPARPGVLALVLPVLNSGWVYGAAATVGVMPPRMLGAIAIGVGSVHALAAALTLRRWPGRAALPGATAMILASTVCLVPAIWQVVRSWAVALPAWSAIAVALAVLSFRTGSGGLRVAGHVMQAAAVAVGIGAGVFAVPGADAWTAPWVGVLLCVLAGWQHHASRRNSVPHGTWLARLDAADRSGLLTLWAAVLAAFCAARTVIHPILAILPVDLDTAFQGAQSVTIHVIAIGLMLIGLRSRCRALLGTAIAVTGIGAIKVFASDMLTIRGVPLVLAVFSFGVAAAVASVILGRWQRLSGRTVDQADSS